MGICIIAGGGNLPLELLKEAKNNNQEPCLILIKDNADKEQYKGSNYIELSVGQIGAAISYMRENQADKIVFAGSVKRPNLLSIIPDWKGTIVLGRILKARIRGDDHLLKTIVGFFEDEGFKVAAATDFLNLNISQKGTITNTKPSDDDIFDINLGINLLDKLSELDIAQAAIISHGRVLSIEGAEGTDELIRRTKNYIKNARTTMVKIPKIGQDRRIDMPTIGPNTIDELAAASITGIAISQEVLVLSKEETIAKANSHSIYIYII